MTLRGVHLSLKRLNLLAKLRIWVDLRRIQEKLSRNNSVRTEGNGNEGEQLSASTTEGTELTEQRKGNPSGRTPNFFYHRLHRLHGWNSWKNWMRSSGQREERLAQPATEPKFFTEGNEESEEKTGKRQPQRHRAHSTAEPHQTLSPKINRRGAKSAEAQPKRENRDEHGC